MLKKSKISSGSACFYAIKTKLKGYMKQKSHDKYTYPPLSNNHYRNLKRGECHAIFGVKNREKLGLKAKNRINF
jgi:hypothetical protein